MFRSRYSTISSLLAAAAILLAGGGGCSNMSAIENPRDDTFRDAAGYDRPGKSSSLPWGVSSRSRDIERDLGVK